MKQFTEEQVDTPAAEAIKGGAPTAGDGVPAQFVPDLFERFTRETGSRGRAPGTGLGLAIARSYARAHQGDLVYEDAEPRGARFKLVLPMKGDVEAHSRRRWNDP